MDITEENIKELGFNGSWYPGEGYCASVGQFGTPNYYSIVLPHNILRMPDRSSITLNSFEELREIISKAR